MANIKTDMSGPFVVQIFEGFGVGDKQTTYDTLELALRAFIVEQHKGQNALLPVGAQIKMPRRRVHNDGSAPQEVPLGCEG